jgi:hypothetical protein
MRDQHDKNGEQFLLHMFLPEDSAGAMNRVMLCSNGRPRETSKQK